MATLWDTTGSDVVKALTVERHAAGSVSSGLALTLVVVVDEPNVATAEAAATMAAAAHPCRLLIVIRRQVDAPVPRLDAEVVIGGRLGPGEAVVMRMQGRLALHAESVVLPLLAPDAPVVTWWFDTMPDRIAHDPLGVIADRRITDCATVGVPADALRGRADDYAPGDTDLAWTRLTPWRSLLASSFDSISQQALGAVVSAERGNASAQLLAGWLRARLGVEASVEDSPGPGITKVHVDLAEDTFLSIDRTDGRTAILRRSSQPDRTLPLPRRQVGELMSEELHRIDADEPYADALAAAVGMADLSERPSVRQHVWLDPAQAALDDAAPTPPAGT